MKIVCDSCSAKYSIADEKVAGRVFKIRCKKCGAAIVVRGDQVDAAAEEESTRVVDYAAGDAVWHVVVEGDQQGPFSPAQIGDMLAANTIGWDAYVWKEGFDDWKPAQDVQDLVSAVMGGGQSEQGGAADMGADPFAAAPATEGPFSGGAPGVDLFAQTDAPSPFGAGGEEDEDVVASAPAPGPGGGPRVTAEQSLTGARNENSVLFSLSNLQALATGSGGGAANAAPAMSATPAVASPRPGHASGEGSGLIDIRALATATGVSPGSGGPITSSANDKVDDLLAIGGAGGAALGSSLGAPVLVPEKKEESNRGLIIGVAAAAAVAIVAAAAAVIVVVMNDRDEPQTTVAAAGTVQPGSGVTTAPAPTPGDTAPGAGTAGAPSDPVAANVPTPTAPANADEDNSQDRDRSARGRPGRGSRANAPAAAGGGAPAREAAPAEPARPARSGGSDSIDDLLNQAIDPGARRAGGGAPAAGGGGGGGGGGGPATPSRSDIVSAMNSVSGPVAACGNGAHGLAPVRIVFAGSTGRVQSAEVSGGSFEPPVRSCIARAVRGARVPQFQQASFSVNYPFRL